MVIEITLQHQFSQTHGQQHQVRLGDATQSPTTCIETPPH